MATKYEALVEARLVSASIQSQIDAAAKGARLEISNITVNTSNLISEIQKSLSSANFQINTNGMISQAQSAGKAISTTMQNAVKNGIGNAQTTRQLNDATAAAKKFADEQKKAFQNQLISIKSSTLSNNIEAWMNKNTVAAKKFGSELDVIRAKLASSPSDKNTLQQASAEFNNIKARARSAGIVVSQFAASIKNVGLQMLGLGSAYQVGMKIYNTIKSGVNTVVELDTALVDLKKTTTMSSGDLEQFYRDANTEAKALGTTTKQIIQSAADWSRLGYSDKDSSTRMARYAAQFAAISPGMNVDEATTGLVSMMKAYGIETNDVLDGIMSEINRVGKWNAHAA